MGSGNGIEFLRNNLSIKDVEKIICTTDSHQPNKFESYLITHNSVKKEDVIDFSGTAYLREYDFVNAITWLKKEGAKTIAKNPFIDLLYDREEQFPSEKNRYHQNCFAGRDVAPAESCCYRQS